MDKNKVCFIAQFPPPVHGLSKAVETLYASELNQAVSDDGRFQFEKVDITNNKNIIKNLILIAKSRADLYYFTISQTIGGNLRDLAILKLLSIQKKRCLVHLHGGYYRQLVDNNMNALQKKANYKAVSKLDGVIVLGQSLKHIFEGMIPNDLIYVVANGVESECLISEEEFMDKISLLKERKTKNVLYLSNFIRSKGYSTVLKMAKLEKEYCMSGKGRRMHFHFAGDFLDKNEKTFFFKYIEEHSLEDYVTYHGVVSGSEKLKLLKLCDTFILLTRYPNEGQPISILEAMGNGMTIVTTNHAGIPDMVKDNENGIVVTEKNINVKKLMGLIMEADNASIGKTNRNAVLENYSQKHYINGMSQVFNSYV